ncbi:fish-egg lectin-like [Hoplias malabaricus]|uniref:fish-egg lectin-like n=1 Tax=Hoplias malabaricus TaxID=27720 RepID=UPI00346331D0
MGKIAVFFVLMNIWTISLALQCTQVPGVLKQIDAANGQVFGVSNQNEIFTLYSNSWMKVPGSLTHVSVGPAGVWGVNKNDFIYKLVRGDWVIVPGKLKQIDAGGTVSPAGVSMIDEIFCLPGGKGSGWTHIPGQLKYYSCGPYSCWGVNSADAIYIMKGVTESSCSGSLNWESVSGGLSMIEVSTDGQVYGVSFQGNIYQRLGVSPDNPAGSNWSQVQYGPTASHVTYDLGHLWILNTDGAIMDCTV